MNDSSSGIGNFLGGLGQVVSGAAPILGTGAQIYGQSNAGEDVEQANNAAIATQQKTLGNIGNIYNPYTTAGAGATAALSSAEGLNGQPANYSGFENMPGYAFAVQQGTQAIQRQAAASGTGYNPSTAASIGQYVTGTAMQDYNTYIGQLQATAGMGANSANSYANLNYNTGANISQLQANTGQSQAGVATGVGQTVAGALGGGYMPYGGNGYGSGVSGYGNIGSGVGNIASGVGTMFGGGTGPGAGGYGDTGVSPYLTSAQAGTNYGMTGSYSPTVSPNVNGAISCLNLQPSCLSF